MKNSEADALAANIASLQGQLEQLAEGEAAGATEELDLEEELGLEAVFQKLESGQPLESGELEVLGQATAGSGELVDDVIAKLVAGEALSPDEVAILKASMEGEGAGEIEAGEKIAKAIVSRTLEGVDRSMAVPLLAGLPGVARGARSLVTKRFASSEAAAAEDNRVRLFGGSVVKDLPETLELMGRRLGAGQEDEEEDDLVGEVLRRAVAKMQTGEALTEEELAEIAAENLQGRPLSLIADMPIHKSLVPLNSRRPVESACLGETLKEISRMLHGERENIVLNKPLRAGARRELVHKSLAGICGALFGGRQ